MAGHFEYRFSGDLPESKIEQGWDRNAGKPLMGDVLKQAHVEVGAVEAFQALPERNQQLLLDMTDFAMRAANSMSGTWGDGKWRENFWGLYVVGSRARNEADDESDLDLLSVGTFYRSQGFLDWRDRSDVFDGFELEAPDELPSEYNVGDVDRKFLVRATPKAEGVLPVDLNVVDLTFWKASLDSFKETVDVADDGSQLPRVPVFEITVSQDRHATRW